MNKSPPEFSAPAAALARPLFILTAVEIEARAIARALRLQRVTRTGHWMDPTGTGVILHVVGIRAVRLPAAMEQARGIILAGVAGALDPALKIGDVVLDAPASPSKISHMLLTLLPRLRIGKILTAPHVIATPREKQNAYEKTAALAVEMEGAVIQAEARRLILPMLHLRAISDTAADLLDPAVLSLVDVFGRPRAAALATALLRHPTLIPYLRRLGRNTQLASHNLAQAVQTIIHSGWPEL